MITVKVHLVFDKIYEFLYLFLILGNVNGKCKSSRPEVFWRRSLKNFIKFNENCEIAKFVKFFRKYILQYNFERLLLKTLGYIKTFACIKSSVYLFRKKLIDACSVANFHLKSIFLFIMKVKQMIQNIWTYQNKIYYYNFDASLISLAQNSNENIESCSEKFA